MTTNRSENEFAWVNIYLHISKPTIRNSMFRECISRLHPFQEIWISLQFQHFNCVALPQSQLPRIQDEDVPPDPRVNERRTTPVVNPHRLGAVETTVSRWIIKVKKRLPLHQIRIDCFFFSLTCHAMTDRPFGRPIAFRNAAQASISLR